MPREKNILFICVDDLRPELKSFGADYIHSPNMDRLASTGRAFQSHYVNAPSCGPSRYTMLTGRYGPYSNHALFQRAKKMKENPGAIPPSMPEWFRQHGYTTVSVGKVSHDPGGLGGKNWDDPNVVEMPNAWDRHLMPVGEWQHPRGAMHGLANGEIRVKPKDMDVFQTVAGPDTIYPDGLIAEEGLKQLEELTSQDKPFFLAIGLIKPHLPFGAPQKYMDFYDGVELPPVAHSTKPEGRTTWHGSGEFMNYNRWGKDPRQDLEFANEVRRHYAACVSYADKQVGDIIAKLKETGADKNTIIVLWGDHGWSLGEQALWGKHSLFEEALHSPLIVYYPGIKQPGVKTNAVVETLDIFPTLCELSGISIPDFVQGVSMLPILEDPHSSGHSAVSYLNSVQSIRTATHRLTLHGDGYVELYDHTSPEKETRNIASQHPALVTKLSNELKSKIESKHKQEKKEPLAKHDGIIKVQEADIKSPNAILLAEAEEATTSTGEVKSHRPTASAGKFVNFNPATPAQYIEWEVSLPASNPYELVFRYANADSSARILKLSVNGKLVHRAVSFPSTKSWNIWHSLNIPDIALKEGTNVIRIETLVNKDGPNIDYLKISAKSMLQKKALEPDAEHVYKTASGSQLKLYQFSPADLKKTDKRSAIVFFFGGGWNGGTASQFYAQADYLAQHGMLAFSADYRVKSRNNTTPFESVEDAKSAVRWIRQHAEELGVDPGRIVAAGGSAGGHIALCTATIDGYNSPNEELSISSVPNAVIGFNPVADTSEKTGFQAPLFKRDSSTSASPIHHVRPGLPPMLIFHGTADRTVPFKQVEHFTKLMLENGNTCRLIPYPGKDHGFFNSNFFRSKYTNEDFEQTMRESVQFLSELKLL